MATGVKHFGAPWDHRQPLSRRAAAQRVQFKGLGRGFPRAR